MRHASVRDGGGRRFVARDGTSGGMRGGVGVRVGGGVAMLLEVGGEGGREECLRQPRMSMRECEGGRIVEREGK